LQGQTQAPGLRSSCFEDFAVIGFACIKGYA